MNFVMKLFLNFIYSYVIILKNVWKLVKNNRQT